MLKVIAGRNNNAAYVIPQGQYGVEQYNIHTYNAYIYEHKSYTVSQKVPTINCL